MDSRQSPFLLFGIFLACGSTSCQHVNSPSPRSGESDKTWSAAVDKAMKNMNEAFASFIFLSKVHVEGPSSEYGGILQNIDACTPRLLHYVKQGSRGERYLALNLLDEGKALHHVSIRQKLLYHIEFYKRSIRKFHVNWQKAEYYGYSDRTLLLRMRHLDGLKEHRVISVRLLWDVSKNPQEYLSQFKWIRSEAELKDVTNQLLGILLGKPGKQSKQTDGKN